MEGSPVEPRVSLPIKGGQDRLPWFAVAVVFTVLVIGGFAVILGLDQGPTPPFLTRSRGGNPPAAIPADNVLRLAGSGSSVPLTRALAAAHAEAGGNRPIVHASIGSGGGIRALLDGAVDVALVSRPLSASERASGLSEIPYARVPIIVAVNADVPDRSIEPAGLLEIYSGRRVTWTNGATIVVLQREQGDSSHHALEAKLPDFRRLNEEAYREGRWRVLYHDAAMEDALSSTPGAIGLHGSGQLGSALSIRALAVGGIAPTLDKITSGQYPYTKDLAFVVLGQPTAEITALIEFTRSPAGRSVIRSMGCVPLPMGPTR